MISRNKVDVLIWTLVYGGLLSIAVSLFLPDQSGILAAWMVACGGGVAAVGAGLVYVRSKMKNPTK